MSFLESAKKAGYSEAEAKDFQEKVTSARKAGYSDDEIQSFLNKGKGPPPTSTTIGPRSTAAPLADQGSIHAPLSAADQTADLIRGGKTTPMADSLMDAAPEVAGATAMLAAAPTGIGMLPAAALAATGGAGGRALQSITRSATGDPRAPATPGAAAADIGGAAVRQGMGEFLGRALIKSIGKVLAGPKFEMADGLGPSKVDPVTGQEVASGVINKAKEILKGNWFSSKPNKVDIKKAEELLATKDADPSRIMEAFGSAYTAAQMTKSKAIDMLDNLAQGSFFGSGTMDKVFAQQKNTIKTISENIADSFTKETGQKMSDRQLGQLFVDTIQDGRTAFHTASEKMFRNVDDLVYENMQLANPEEVNPFIYPGETGTTVANPPSVMGAEPLPDVIPTKKPSESGYVNTKPLIEKAKELLADYGRVRNIGKTEAGGNLLDKVAALPDTMPFGDAQLLRSVLLEEKRQLAREGGRSLRFATEFSGIVDAQMEKAASRLSGDALTAWRDANKFYKFGKQNFDNDFINKLTRDGKVNWEEVGDNIFRSGNVDEIYKTRRALRTAEFMSKKAGEGAPVDFQKTWRQMQSGYYESLLRKNTTPDGNFNPDGLLKDLNNKKTSRTIQAAFNNDQLNAVKNFARVAKLAESGNKSGGMSMAIQLGQGGLILALANPMNVFGDYGDQNVTLLGAASVLIPPIGIAKLLTSPMATRWLIQGLKTPISSGASGGIALRIAHALVRAKQNSVIPAEEK